MEDRVGLRICYEGQVHQMDLDILLGSLLRFAEMTKAVSREIMPEDQDKFQIKVNATEKGSFIVFLELPKLNSGLFNFLSNNAVTIGSLGALIGIVVNIFKIKEFLGGKKPDKISDGGNNTTIVAKKMLRL